MKATEAHKIAQYSLVRKEDKDYHNRLWEIFNSEKTKEEINALYNHIINDIRKAAEDGEYKIRFYPNNYSYLVIDEVISKLEELGYTIQWHTEEDEVISKWKKQSANGENVEGLIWSNDFLTISYDYDGWLEYDPSTVFNWKGIYNYKMQTSKSFYRILWYTNK